jgi:hypothetical protein
MIVIGPFFESCGIYTEIPSACASVQLIAFVGFALTIGFGIMILILVGCLIILYDSIRSDNQSHQDPILRSATQFLEAYNPIPIPDSHTICTICQSEVADDADKAWTALQCGHTFHIDCLSEWYKYSQTCPHCRITIVVNDEVSV